MPRLIADRVVTKADLGGVEEFCIARGMVREIAEKFQAGGMDPRHFGMMNRASDTARKLAAEYGLSPVSRARIGKGASNEDEDDNPLNM